MCVAVKGEQQTPAMCQSCPCSGRPRATAAAHACLRWPPSRPAVPGPLTGRPPQTPHRLLAGIGGLHTTVRTEEWKLSVRRTSVDFRLQLQGGCCGCCVEDDCINISYQTIKTRVGSLLGASLSAMKNTSLLNAEHVASASVLLSRYGFYCCLLQPYTVGRQPFSVAARFARVVPLRASHRVPDQVAFRQGKYPSLWWTVQ